MSYKDFLMHRGTPHEGMIPHSGRWPYGSSGNVDPEDLIPFKFENSFLDEYRALKDKGLTDNEIAKSMGMSSTDFRKDRSDARIREREAYRSEIYRLDAKDWSQQAIADHIGKNESYVRSVLDTKNKERLDKNLAVISALKDNVDSNKYVDIGPGAEAALGITRTRLMNAARSLENEGYVRENIYVRQVGMNNGQKTTINVLAVPGTTKQDITKNKDKIGVIGGVKGINGDYTSLGIQTPTSVDRSRIYVRYAEDGGKDKDGTIELRRNVPDLSLGNAKYAQVRIAVDDVGYMKGIAFYSDNIPKGYDIVYNSNRHVGAPDFKTKDNPAESVFKSLKDDPDNPFGTTFKMEKGVIVGQKMYKDKDGTEKLSPINIVREEGDWNTWSKTLASQFLSKQPIQLINQQLKKSYDEKEQEYKEIMALTNPAIRQKLLDSFADDCDASAVHLKAAALPRQSSKVILPIPELADNEVYAPTYDNGEEVVLVRYPHEGTFEIPRLIVNNNHKVAKDIIGNAVDAVGINPNVANILSGADFDGDTVVVIPTKGQNIVTMKPLDGLKTFDTKESYRIPDDIQGEARKKLLLTEDQKQMQMGIVSNLITDMTLQGAPPDELERATKHSMVIIDAVKHELDWKRSERDNQIALLHKKYQGKTRGGAATIISRASKEVQVNDRKSVYSVNAKDKDGNYLLTPEQKKEFLEGKKFYVDTGKTKDIPVKPASLKNKYGANNVRVRYKDNVWVHKMPDGSWRSTGIPVEYKTVNKTTTSSLMAETNNAFDLTMGTGNKKEVAYAEYANKLKALANQSRKESMLIEPYEVSASAKDIYAKEIESLEANLKLAKANKPLERKAQAVANVIIADKIRDNNVEDADERKKIQQQALAQARRMTGANKIDTMIQISDAEWEAIQAHAVSFSKLKEIIANADEDRIKQLATPRSTKDITPTQINKIKGLASGGSSIAEIARSLGISTSAVSQVLMGGN